MLKTYFLGINELRLLVEDPSLSKIDVLPLQIALNELSRIILGRHSF
jgi:hypothetical protein